MARFPVVQQPCPYVDRLDAIMVGDMCRMCKRPVFDLMAMDDAGRADFLSNCSGEVCVSYKLPFKTAIAAAALAGMAVPMAAAAQDADVTAEAGGDDLDYIIVVAGGIKDLNKLAYVESAADMNMPELPVVYEDEPAVSSETPAY
jgi:hypothetical protein